MPDFRVIKTLVIGLGSTGTQVCNALADRIEWEVGDLSKAPWVEFLCIETNAQEKSRFNPGDNFRTLSLDANEYSDIINNPKNYNESIALEQWADITTLRKLNGSAVDAGAGNIRMVGRLALLYSRNFRNIKIALNERIERLRSLMDASAKAALNKDAPGHESEVVFAEGLRIIVTGTLLGGTCSGTCSDMGILLQTITRKEERLMGIFTLPHPDYTISHDNLAELHKVNSYHALQELNQYQNNTDRERYKTIKHYDKPYGESVLDASVNPYDLIYLVRAREVTSEGRDKINGAVADRIFLNIFVPEADPMATTVDGGVIPPKDGRSFAFATFGLSTIDYPVRRIMEACKLKLLTHAFRQWNSRKLETKLKDNLNDLGFTSDNLLELLLRDESNASIKTRLEGKQREVLNHARRGDTEAARKAIEEYRSAFVRDKGDGFKGLAVRTVEANRIKVANELIQNVVGLVRSKLLDYDFGPAPILEILDGIPACLGELRAWEGNEIKPGAVGNVLDRIEALKRNALLGTVFLRTKAIGRLMNSLNRALNDEAKARIEQTAKAMLRDTGSGVRTLSLVETELIKVRKRLQNLQNRITTQVVDIWRPELIKLEALPSDVNGLSLFIPAPDGTVANEFQRYVPDETLEGTAAGIIRGWTDLPKALLPSGNDPDWLIQPFVQGKDVFNSDQIQALESDAVAPFREIRNSNKDVVTRLFEATSPQFSPSQKAMAAANAATVFLPINDELGQPDPMSPLPKEKLLFGNKLPPKFTDTITPWRSTSPIAQLESIDNPFRIVMLEEWYKFSLRGSADITQLANAKSSLFNTYFTRKREDIDWTPLSDAEINELKDAENLLITGLLHDILRLEYGYLVMDWSANLGEDADPAKRQRRFPAKIERASRMLAFSDKDARGMNLDNVRTRLNALIESKYRTEFVEKHKEIFEAQRNYVRYLQKQLLESNARVVDGWNEAHAIKLVMARLKSKGLLAALYREFPPEDELLQSLFKHKGDPKPKGGFFSEDGFYCLIDGGLVGKNREEALDNGLACQFYPDDPLHPFNREWNAFGIYK
jgi:hypothetical protein